MWAYCKCDVAIAVASNLHTSILVSCGDVNTTKHLRTYRLDLCKCLSWLSNCVRARRCNAPTFITKALCLITHVKPLKSPSQWNYIFYGTSIALLSWFLSQHASLQWSRPCIELLHYISKHNKLVHWLYRFNIT